MAGALPRSGRSVFPALVLAAALAGSTAGGATPARSAPVVAAVAATRVAGPPPAAPAAPTPPDTAAVDSLAAPDSLARADTSAAADSLLRAQARADSVAEALAAGLGPAGVPADSVRVHGEIGAAANVTNEQYYEASYTDTTFLGRQLHSTPESWLAGTAALDVVGAAGLGRWQYGLHPDLTLGGVVTQADVTGSLRYRPDERWQLALDPRAEYLRDRSFDIERREQLLGTTLRARRQLEGDGDFLNLRAGGEWLATPGSPDPYLLAHRDGTVGAGWSHDGLVGWDWDGRYDATLRTFPDSTQRDHVEHELGVDLRRDFEGGRSAGLELDVVRRQAIYTVPSSRDRFVEARAELQGRLDLDERWGLVGALEGDAYRYDAPDSSIDFDYELGRLTLQVRRELAAGWSLALGPRLEVVGAPWNPSERYTEGAGVATLEVLGSRRWWQVEPEAGWRGYTLSETGHSTDPAALHSSYAFAELLAYGEQSLPARLRVRLALDARIEQHQDPSQDSRGLYFSLDVRRLF